MRSPLKMTAVSGTTWFSGKMLFCFWSSIRNKGFHPGHLGVPVGLCFVVMIGVSTCLLQRSPLEPKPDCHKLSTFRRPPGESLGGRGYELKVSTRKARALGHQQLLAPTGA